MAVFQHMVVKMAGWCVGSTMGAALHNGPLSMGGGWGLVLGIALVRQAGLTWSLGLLCARPLAEPVFGKGACTWCYTGW